MEKYQLAGWIGGPEIIILGAIILVFVFINRRRATVVANSRGERNRRTMSEAEMNQSIRQEHRSTELNWNTLSNSRVDTILDNLLVRYRNYSEMNAPLETLDLLADYIQWVLGGLTGRGYAPNISNNKMNYMFAILTDYTNRTIPKGKQEAILRGMGF